MTNEQLDDLFALKHELPGVECKGPGPRGDDYLRAKVARAIMGMSNRRDGGIVIIGIEDRNSQLHPVGLSPQDAISWRNYDHVASALASYMSPPASFRLYMHEVAGKEFALLEVSEFADVPIICKKGYARNHASGHSEVVLREGAIYIRGRLKPETVETSSLERMRELLDLAVEKGVKKFVTQAQRAGLGSLTTHGQPNDDDLFKHQAEDWNTPLLEKIETRGFWRTIIRPTTFQESFIPYNDLLPLVSQTKVELQGEHFPNILFDHPTIPGIDCVGQEIEAGQFLEAWNMYQSGQFIHYAGLIDDWLDAVGGSQIPTSWRPGTMLAIEEVVRQYTGVFILASRLALTSVFSQDDHLIIDVLLKGLQGRRLYVSSSGKNAMRNSYTATIAEFPYRKKVSKEELIANPTQLALQASKELFLRFQWDALYASLESTQGTFYKGK